MSKGKSRLACLNEAFARMDSGKSITTFRVSYLNDVKLAELGIKVYQSKQGVNEIRILPPPTVMGNDCIGFGYEIFPHFSVGGSNDSFLCPKAHRRGDCPCCEKWRDIKAEYGDNKGFVPENIYKQYSSLRSMLPRYLLFIVDVASEETKALGVQIYDAPRTINEELRNRSKCPETGATLDLSDPVDGRVFIFKRVGTKKEGTKYSGFDTKPKSLEISSSILKQIPADFSEVVVFHSYDEMKKAMAQPMPTEQEVEHEDEVTERKEEPIEKAADLLVGAEDGTDDSPPFDDTGDKDTPKPLVNKSDVDAKVASWRERVNRKG